MSLAPSPTTIIDGVDCFAQPSKTGAPRNAWIVFTPIIDLRGHRYRGEVTGAMTRDAATRKAAPGDLLVERDKHEWTPTPHRKTPFHL
jgi:hypothetical protein